MEERITVRFVLRSEVRIGGVIWVAERCVESLGQFERSVERGACGGAVAYVNLWILESIIFGQIEIHGICEILLCLVFVQILQLPTVTVPKSALPRP